MTNAEKVKKSVEIIKKLGLSDQIFTAEEVFQSFRNANVFEIADALTGAINAINDIRDILESEE